MVTAVWCPLCTLIGINHQLSVQLLQIRVHITDHDRAYRTVTGLLYKNRHSSANERSLYVPIRECNVRNAFLSVIPPLANQRSQGRAHCPLHRTRVLSIHIRSRERHLSCLFAESRTIGSLSYVSTSFRDFLVLYLRLRSKATYAAATARN